jgi:mRNA interferase MazF
MVTPERELRQGDIVWVDYGVPLGSEAGYRRPSVVVQGNDFNASRIATTICIPLTGNLRFANLPGSVLLRQGETGLDRDSVAQAHLVTAVDRSAVLEWVGRLEPAKREAVRKAIDLVMGG